MQAVVFEQPGNPLDVLSVREVASPAPGPGQVLVRVTARPQDVFEVNDQVFAQIDTSQMTVIDGAET